MSNPYINDDIRVMNVMEMWRRGELPENRIMAVLCKALQKHWNEIHELKERIKVLETPPEDKPQENAQ